MPREVVVAVAAFAVAAAMMLAELRRSRSNERVLRARGAVEPSGDVYRPMAIGYPGMFVVMAIEGALAGPSRDSVFLAGVVIFAAAKLLKLWAIASLGPRWSYRVLVLPGAPLISSGAYARLRHPNYVAVVGEIAGFALIVGARISGVIALVGFSLLLRKRITVEEKALAGSRYT
jgi:methyltransferase